MMSRPDQWSSHYNLGNYYLSRQNFAAAVSSYGTAIRFDPTEVLPYVNLSIAYARKGDNPKADEALRKALTLEPNNAEANFNMGLLKAELNDPPQAEKHLRRALKADPQMAPAAYNLCVLLGEKRTDEALGFCRQATTIQPNEPRYGWTYAYYQKKKGDSKAAARTLEDLLNRQPAFADGYLLLAEIRFQKGDRKGAEQVLEKALDVPSLSQRDRAKIEGSLRSYRAGDYTAPADVNRTKP
jgi:Tfp pilus assembly protein PilF